MELLHLHWLVAHNSIICDSIDLKCCIKILGRGRGVYPVLSPYSTQKLLENQGHCVTIYTKEQRKKRDYQKKGTFNTEISNFTLLVLNQSSISAVPLIVRCPRDQKTALMGDPLYLIFLVAWPCHCFKGLLEYFFHWIFVMLRNQKYVSLYASMFGFCYEFCP